VTATSNVLVFPAGSEIGLEIRDSLKYSHHVTLFGASGKSDHASYVYDQDRYCEDPGLYVDAPDFVERFNRLLALWRIDFVYPTHDTIACFLAQRQPEITAKVLTSCYETNRVARYKRETYRLFAQRSFCPRIHVPPYDDVVFPVFLKPDDGQGGKGTCVARDSEELAFHLARDPVLLVSEYLPGEELSVDCFTDSGRQLRFVGPRTRERIQMGISFRSTAVEATEELEQIARCINGELALDGAWFFQVKKDRTGAFKLMEFAPRQSSTMGLYRHAGVNFALLSLFNARGLPVEVAHNGGGLQLDRCLHNRYKTSLLIERVYIDLDETIIFGDSVHEYVMAYLYQCRNRGVRITLITKHRQDVTTTLGRFGISPNLFDEIILVSEAEQKWDFMDPSGAIFIDNYWHDRKAVREKLGIPVFDVDGIEGLLR